MLEKEENDLPAGIALPKLRAVAFREGDGWIAHILEYYLVMLARSLEELPGEVERVLTLQIQASAECGVEAFEGYSVAPLRFWERYQGGTPLANPYRTEIRTSEGERPVRALVHTSALGPFNREDYLRLPDKPRCELLYGRLLRSPKTSPDHQIVVSLLWRRFDGVAGQGGGLALAGPL